MEAWAADQTQSIPLHMHLYVVQIKAVRIWGWDSGDHPGSIHSQLHDPGYVTQGAWAFKIRQYKIKEVMSFGLTELFVPWMTGSDHALQSQRNITSPTWTTVLSLSTSWNS